MRPATAEQLERRVLLAAGSLDTSFGVGGKASVNTLYDEVGWVRDLLIQPDGKTLVAGHDDFSNPTRAIVTRYNADGSLDAGFGNGTGIAAAPDYGTKARVIALQADGKIVVAAETGGGQEGVYRFTANGLIDTTFGVGGKVQLPNLQSIDAITVQPDQSILVGGEIFTAVDDFFLAKITSQGQLDGTFGVGGTVTTDFQGGRYDNLIDIGVLADGKILAAGTTSIPVGATSKPSVVFVRYNADGSLDETFDGDGKVGGVVASPMSLYLAEVLGDGRVIFGGRGGTDSAYLGVARYTAAGTLDNTFSGDGMNLITAQTMAPLDLAVGGDDSIALAGYEPARSNTFFSDPIIARFTAQGEIDTSFGGGDGYLVDSYVADGNYEDFQAVGVRSDGRIVAAGSGGVEGTFYGRNRPFVLQAYTAAGARDATFGGGDGAFSHLIPNSAWESVADVLVLPDGKLLVAGMSEPAVYLDRAMLTRFNADGTLDHSFDGDGILLVQYQGRMTSFNAMVRLPDGDVLVGGEYTNPNVSTQPKSLLARFNPDGSLETSFGSGGFLADTFNEPINAIALLSDGRVLVAGNTLLTRHSPDTGAKDMTFANDAGVAAMPTGIGYINALAVLPDDRFYLTLDKGDDFPSSSDYLRLYRRTANGLADNTFGPGGQAPGGASVTNTTARGLALRPDGKIVVAGRRQIAQFTSTGQLDAGAFGSGGVRVIDVGPGDDRVTAIELQPDGKLLVAAYTGDIIAAATSNFELFRLDRFGNLDGSFGTGGRVSTDFAGRGDWPTAMAIAGDRLFVAGKAYADSAAPIHGLSDDLAVAKYDLGFATLGADGTLTIAGDAGDNQFAVSRAAAAAGGAFVFTRDGWTVQYASSSFDAWALDTGAGDDTVQLDFGSGSLMRADGATITGGAGGDDTIIMNGSSAADVFGVTADGVFFNGQGVMHSGIERIRTAGGGADTLNIQAGNYVVAVENAVTTINVGTAANVTFDAPLTSLAALNISGNVGVMNGGDKVLRVESLEIAVDGGGMLDLADNDLVIDYTGATPTGSWNGSAYAAVTGMLQSAFHFNQWDRPGLRSSAAAAMQGVTTLAIGEARDVLFLAEGETMLWNGAVVDATTVIVKYTYAGDLNLDGLVDAGDYGVIDNYYQVPGTSGYANGDINFDGIIDAADYGYIDNSFQMQGPRL